MDLIEKSCDNTFIFHAPLFGLYLDWVTPFSLISEWITEVNTKKKKSRDHNLSSP